MSCGALCAHLLCTRRCRDQVDIENVERSVHIQYLKYAYEAITSSCPDIEVNLYLYATDGIIERVPTTSEALVLVDRF